MKEVWYYLYRDYGTGLEDKVYSSMYYDTFDEAWESRDRMKNSRNDSGRPISPVMKGFMKDE